MKYFYVISFTLLSVLSLNSFAQCTGTCGSNLITNPSFETATGSCDPSDIQLYNSQTPVADWFGTDNYPGAGSSPDYFSPCAGSTNNANNNCITGNARVGIFTRSSFSSGREYIQSQLSTPLQAGKIYCFSMVVKSKVGAAGNTLSSCDGIGAWFHNLGLINIQTMNGGNQFLGAGSTINASAQVENPSGNMIDGNCTTVTGTFCATGGEDWIVIGNFRGDASTQMVGSSSFNYMYVEDVTLFEICYGIDLSAPSTTINCGDSTILTTSVTGYSSAATYNWILPLGNTLSGAGPHIVNPETTTTYQVVVEEGCVRDTATITINVSGLCGPYTSITDTSICEGECINIEASAAIGGTPPYTYTWSPNIGNDQGPFTVCLDTTTIFYVTVTDAVGLSYTDTATVTVNQIPVIDAGMDDSICSGNSITLNGVANIGTVQWVGGSNSNSYTVTPAATTMYYFRANNNGCLSEDSVLITVFNHPSISVSSTNVSCYGLQDGSAIANVSAGNPPYTYLWMPTGDTTPAVNNLSSGTYWVKVFNVAGCSSADTITISEPLDLVANITGDTLICEEENVTLVASAIGGIAGYNYNWFGYGNSNTITVQPQGQEDYLVEVTDANNCKDTASISVTSTPRPMADFVGTFKGCPPVEATFSNTSIGATTYLWSFDNITTNLANPVPHSFYTEGCNAVTLIATSINGCMDTLTKSCAVEVYPQPTAGISADDLTIYENESEVTFYNEAVNSEYCYINFGDGNESYMCNSVMEHLYESTGTYTVVQIVSNSYGCSDTSSLNIEILPETTIWVPNAFTPNGNGINEVFKAKGSNVEEFNLKIFNRWGEMIYESEDIDEGWNGSYQGEIVQQDVYIWIIHYRDSRDGKKSLTGKVSILK
ncbi:MAG: gliding motility-associated C-terminal domain-containing protein [Flavobacteriales bacterium]